MHWNPLRTNSFSGVLRRAWVFVPEGGSLADDVWQSRHRFLLGLTLVHAVIIAAIGPLLGYSWELSLDALFHDGTVLHTVFEGLIVAALAGAAAWKGASRTFRATAVGFGLMSSSAILVHLSGGYIELHFHFFVMLAFLALYQDWTPYLLCILYVALHHGAVGVLWPEEVFNHTAALNAPWTWAAIHAFFILWASVGSIVAWRFSEKANAQTKLVLESVGEGIFGLDREGKVTFINPMAANILGFERHQVVGMKLDQILHRTRDYHEPFPKGRSKILAPLSDRTARQGVNEVFWRMDGTSFPVDYITTPIIERGELVGVVVTFRDVTERNRLEDETNQLKADFTAMMVHDLRSPIMTVLGAASILQEGLIGPVNDEQKRWANKIEKASRDLLELINDFLDLSKIEAGRIDLTMEETDLVRLIRENLDDCRVLAEQKNISLKNSADPTLPPVKVDSRRVDQILTNLLSNAIKFTPEGGEVEVGAVRKDETGITVWVKDTGIGIAADDMKGLFTKYHQTLSGKSLQQKGTGLGLVICKMIVESHGGNIWVESEFGRGSNFQFMIPFESRADDAADEKRNQSVS